MKTLKENVPFMLWNTVPKEEISVVKLFVIVTMYERMH